MSESRTALFAVSREARERTTLEPGAAGGVAWRCGPGGVRAQLGERRNRV
jgi:hypothetical protein